MFISGADAEAKQIVGGLVQAVGCEPADLGGWKTALLTDAPGRNGAVYEKLTHPPMRGKSPAWLLGTLPQLMHLATKLRSNVRLEVTSSAHTDGCDEFEPRNCYISGPGQRTKTSGEWFVSTSLQRRQIQETRPNLDFDFVTTCGVEEEIHNG
jgi:hypothetical protein